MVFTEAGLLGGPPFKIGSIFRGGTLKRPPMLIDFQR